jgi:CBS-domain-containing membrane protein
MRKLIDRLDLDGHIRRRDLRRYLLQCTLVGVFVLILLLVLDAVTQTVLIAALGASTFIAFVVPRSLHSDPRHMIGGYLVGIAVGCLIGTLYLSIDFADASVEHGVMILFGAFATALAMFVMVVTKTEHPPAAALALGLALNEWNFLTILVILVILAGIISLSVFKRLVLPVLMDLI